MRSGLVSISFRKLSIESIIDLCVKAHLEEIEWGGDVHVPLGDLDAARKASRLTAEAGLGISCYGSYVRMTKEERRIFPDLVDTARTLGAPAIRVWAGTSEDDDLEETAESSQELCDLAKDLVITFEFHGGTHTHDAASACRLLRLIDRPNIQTQWQPPVSSAETENLSAIELIRPWLYNVHVFSWDGLTRLPLSAKEAEWNKYLRSLQGDRAFLLEFVQDDDPSNLLRDAAVLHRWLREI